SSAVRCARERGWYGVETHGQVLYVAFFFSSRRRHTRSDRDWSSDVCSSDLETVVCDLSLQGAMLTLKHLPQLQSELELTIDAPRSEERRVGKECRSRWSPEQ